MKPAELEQALTRFLETLVNDPRAVINTDTELLVSGVLDSLAVAQLIDFLEETLDRTIPPVDLIPEHFDSIRHMLAYLEANPRYT
ncbi:MAG: acyl carrier protein [Pseudomonadota bacterium]